MLLYRSERLTISTDDTLQIQTIKKHEAKKKKRKKTPVTPLPYTGRDISPFSFIWAGGVLPSVSNSYPALVSGAECFSSHARVYT